jgi:drug/metabolite transporter (DMT)-like permease
VTAVLLALATSVCYGTSNFVGPLISRDLPTYAVLIAGQVVAFVVSGALVLATAHDVPSASVWLAAAGAGLGNAWGLICFYRAASLGPLSIVTPIGALGALVPVAAGVASGEGLGAVKVAGIVLALGGVALAARRPPNPGERAADMRGAVAWALASVLGFGSFLALVAPASEDGVYWAVVLSRAMLLLSLGAAAAVMGAAIVAPLSALPKVAVPGVLLFAGTLAYSAATREGDLSVVSVVGSLFPVVTVGLAFALLGERLSRAQALGVAAALLGVVLVSIR